MSNIDQPVRACVLKVNVKCCSSCRNKAKRKLQNVPGVSAAEYNVQKGLMTVTGDVDPMSLVHKLTRSKKKSQLVSVDFMPDNDFISSDEEEDDDDDDEDEDDDDDTSSDDTSSDHDPRHMERATQVNMMPTIKKKKEGILRKYLLLGCLRSKPKFVQPFPLAKRMFGTSRFGNGVHGNALANGMRPPPPFHGPMNPQQLHMMMQQPPPQFQMSGAAPMHMMQHQLGPLPYFLEVDPQYKAAGAMSMFPQPPKPDPKMLVNNNIHYSGR